MVVPASEVLLPHIPHHSPVHLVCDFNYRYDAGFLADPHKRPGGRGR